MGHLIPGITLVGEAFLCPSAVRVFAYTFEITTFFDRSVESVDTFVRGAGLALFFPLLSVVIVDTVHQTRTDGLTVALAADDVNGITW